MSKLRTAARLIVNNPSNIVLAMGRNGLLKWLPDKIYLKIVFRLETGYPLCLSHPRTYNEKLQWIKLYDRRAEYKILSDKYEVRHFVSDNVGLEYLPILYGVYDNPHEIIWEELPNKFVLKSTNGSGGDTVLICKNKTSLKYEDVIEMIEGWMKRDPYCSGREWCYKDTTPRVICEELLENQNDDLPPDDYKFMCFNGEPKLIQYHHDRFGNHTLNYYLPDWSMASIKRIDEAKSDSTTPKPAHLEEMLEVAKKLSSKIPYARIDLYDTPKGVKFGEITLYPTAGFSTFENYQDDLLLGSWLHLPCDD